MTSRIHASANPARRITAGQSAAHPVPAITQFLERLVVRAARVAATGQMGERSEVELGRRTGGRV
jgi:hypothetical protein